MAGRWFAAATSSHAKNTVPSTRILIFNQQKRDASALARRLHTTLAAAMEDPQPFQHAIFCSNTTYRSSGYKADLVSINTNQEDIGSLRVQRELAETYDLIDPGAKVHVLGTVEEAVARARELADGHKTEVLVTGSLHLVGGLLEVLESEAEVT